MFDNLKKMNFGLIWPALVVLFLFAPSLVQSQAQLPSLPPRYHLIVNANILEKGYSVGWEEWYDSSQGNNLLRANGRFVPPEQVQIVDFNKNVMFSYDSSQPQAGCVYYNTSTLGRGSFFVNPVTSMFNQFNASSVTYNGQQISSRGIMADVYVASSDRTFTSRTTGLTTHMTFTATHEWTIPTSTLSSLPLSIQLNGFFTTSYPNGTIVQATNFNHYYSFLEWSTAPINPSIFTYPSGCSLSNSPPTGLNRNIVNQVQPQASFLTFPQIPNAFETFVEIKSSQGPSSSNRFSVVTPSWNFRYDTNPLTRSESLSYYDFARDTPISLIWNYGVVNSANYGNTTMLDGQTCTYGTIPSPFSSPTSFVRAGFVPELFSNSGSYGFGNFQQRTTVRGVPADSWIIPNLKRTVDGVVYSFQSQVYFYPQGWQFPSFSNSNGFVPPLRVVNTGSFLSPGQTVPTPYSDIWDFVLFEQTVPPSSDFDPSTICPPSPNPVSPNGQMNNGDSSSSSSATGAAVFFALLSLALGLWIGYKCYKDRKHNPRPTSSDHTQLSEQI